MKYKLKGLVNMKLKGGEKFKLGNVLCIPQAVNNLLGTSRIAIKGNNMSATKDKMTIKKNGFSVNLNARKVQNGSTMFHFNSKRIFPGGLTNQDSNQNLTAEDKVQEDTDEK